MLIPIAIAILLLLLNTTQKMQYPVKAPIITSPFGKRLNPTNKKVMQDHNGLDLISKAGDLNIYAPMDGVVKSYYNDTVYGGGNTMVLQHHSGWRSGYAHLKKNLVKAGDTVKQGQPIAIMGNTGGHTTGTHLHWTVTNPAGTKVDPTTVIGKELAIPNPPIV